MIEYTCMNCGKIFLAKKSSKRKFCCKECADTYRKGKPNVKNQKELVEVVCAECGKHEFVNPSRAKKYVCCSTECLSKYNSDRYSKKIECTCPVCGSIFHVKPSRIKRVKTTICCSKECSNILKETTYLGNNNHQFGLIGDKNASFKGNETISQYGYILEYCPGHPKPCDSSNKGTRVRQHRLVIERNHDKFPEEYFEDINGWIVLKDEYDVHHINEDKTDNRLENLQVLTRSEHTTLHNKLIRHRATKYKEIIGVFKQGELLGTPEVDNQQPSIDSNIDEGSTTNIRVQTDSAEDSNDNTSALLDEVFNILRDDIV